MGTSESKSSNKNRKRSISPKRKSPRRRSSTPPPPAKFQQQQQQQQQQQVLPLQQQNNTITNFNPEDEDPIVAFNPEQAKTQEPNDAAMQEAVNLLGFELIPQTPYIEKGVILPVVLQVNPMKSSLKPKRAPIDLVCVVDISGSMSGQKLKLVKDSLRYIMKVLNEDDRMSIVTFDTRSEIQLNWTRNTPENKQKIKSSILNMHDRGSTNIAEGLRTGLQLIKLRKYKNPVTCMFLLSDGQDDNKGAELRAQQYLAEAQIQDSFEIATFGYGSDHDAKVMDLIAQLKNGTFTYIENIQKAAEHFILAISGMLSIYAKNIEIFVQSIKPFEIKKVYGEGVLWHKWKDGYKFVQNFLLIGQSREYIFEVLLEDAKIQDQLPALTASIAAQLMDSDLKFSKDSFLKLKLRDASDTNILNHPLVEINYLRAKAGDQIEEARELAQAKNFDQAIGLLNVIINQIESSANKDDVQLQKVLKDLEKCKQVCTPQLYQKEGEAIMRKNNRKNIQRQQSVENANSWNSDQEEIMDDFKQGNLQLSVCDMDEDRDDMIQFQVPIRADSRNRSQSPVGSMASDSPRVAQLRRSQSPQIKRRMS